MRNLGNLHEITYLNFIITVIKKVKLTTIDKNKKIY